MKKRAVYSTPSVVDAQRAMEAAPQVGVKEDDISLIARSDISLVKIPDDYKNVEGDFYAGAVRGAPGGNAVGLLAGLAALAIPPLGFTSGGAALLTLGGWSLGAWSTALSGAAAPGAVERAFAQKIESGRILVVIDQDDDDLDRARQAIERTGAKPLPFEQASIVS